MITKLAQNIKISGYDINGPLPTLTGAGNAGKVEFASLASVVTKALSYLFPIAGLFLFMYLVWGGFNYLLSMGDPKKAEAGKNKITSAIIGFLLIFAAYWLVQLLVYIFKIPTSY